MMHKPSEVSEQQRKGVKRTLLMLLLFVAAIFIGSFFFKGGLL